MTGPEHDGPACAASGCTRMPAPVLCAPDAGELGDMLAELGTLYDALDARPSMQGREPDTGGTGALASQQAPARLDVIALRDPRTRVDQPDPAIDGVLPVLVWWANAVRQQRWFSLHGTTPTVASERRTLAINLDWILEQPAAGQFHDAIRRLWTRLRAANGHTPDRPVVRCRRDVDGGECGGRVRLADGQATCASCGHTVSGLALLRHGTAA